MQGLCGVVAGAETRSKLVRAFCCKYMQMWVAVWLKIPQMYVHTPFVLPARIGKRVTQWNFVFMHET